MNAKEELSFLKFKDVKCAQIKHFILPVGHTQDQFHAFLEMLDFEYDDGYGGQELFGTIWLTNGSWMTRGEYDGSEWWETNSLPEIPQELTRKEFNSEDGGIVYVCK